MKYIILTQGKKTLVDDENYDYLNQWKWSISSNGYAVRRDKMINKIQGKIILMHRLINNTPNGFDTDHINRNKLDNRQYNLRTVDRSLNSLNKVAYKNNTSGYKGVYWSKPNNKWMAKVFVKGKQIHLGYFKDVKEANLARTIFDRGIL